MHDVSGTHATGTHVNGTGTSSRPFCPDGYVLIFGNRARIEPVQQLLWEHGILSYVANQNLSADTIKLRRGHPALLLAYVDELNNDALAHLERVRRQKSIPLLCVVSLGLPGPRLLRLMDLATDFIRAPVEPLELLLRMQRLDDAERLHSTHDGTGNTLTTAPDQSLQVRSPQPLSPVERRILSVLERSLGTTVDFAMLSQCVEGETMDQRIRTLRVHVSRMRRKLEPNPKRPRYIVNDRATGYRLTRPVLDASSHS